MNAIPAQSGSSTARAIVFARPGRIEHRSVPLVSAEPTELVVDIETSGISTGTEKLLWRGTMPHFPGLGYPLIPGYEAVGTVRGAGGECRLRPGERVFVPGTSRWQGEVRGLFGASASRLVVAESRVTPVGDLAAEHAVLLALAATAMHTLTARLRHAGAAAVPLSRLAAEAPELIVGHGVLGRLLARIVLGVGAAAPLVWDVAAARREGARGYPVIDPADDDGTPRRRITDVSGAGGDLLDTLIARLARGGHVTLAGFYEAPLSFAFPPAFMREASLSVAAEWVPDDLALVLGLVEAGALDLDDLVTHTRPAADAPAAYRQAFDDPDCLKMLLDWSSTA